MMLRGKSGNRDAVMASRKVRTPQGGITVNGRPVLSGIEE